MATVWICVHSCVWSCSCTYSHPVVACPRLPGHVVRVCAQHSAARAPSPVLRLALLLWLTDMFPQDHAWQWLLQASAFAQVLQFKGPENCNLGNGHEPHVRSLFVIACLLPHPHHTKIRISSSHINYDTYSTSADLYVLILT